MPPSEGHSGECIHDPIWEGRWDAIIVAPGPLYGSNAKYYSGSNIYKIVKGYSASECVVCDTCTSSPEYFTQYLLYKLQQDKTL